MKRQDLAGAYRLSSRTLLRSEYRAPIEYDRERRSRPGEEDHAVKYPARALRIYGGKSENPLEKDAKWWYFIVHCVYAASAYCRRT